MCVPAIAVPIASAAASSLAAPTTAFALSAGLTAAQAGLGFLAQQQAAQAQADANAATAQSAANAFALQQQQTQEQLQQQRQGANQEGVQRQKEFLTALGRVQASAGEAGISGVSLDAVIDNYNRQLNEAESVINFNFDVQQQNAQNQLKSARAGAQGRINSLQDPIGPSIFTPLAQTFGGVLNAYDDYLAPSPGMGNQRS